MTITTAIAASALSASSQPLSVSAEPAPSKGTSAISGIAAMSWNSRMPSPLRPIGTPMRLRSVIVCTAIAVDDIASASPATTATCHDSPSSSRPPASSNPDSSICAPPPPKTGPFSSFSRLTSSSSPIRNSMSTTPNSAKCRIDSTSDTKARPKGPIRQPAIR